jgi:hypothetical protein
MTVTYKKQSVDFWELLTLLFIGLKLSHQIDWSWFWVLSPGIFVFVLQVVVTTVGKIK